MQGLGPRLKEAARRLGLADAEVARRAGLDVRRYANYVQEAREPDLATLVTICRVLNTTPDALLGFVESSPQVLGDDSPGDLQSALVDRVTALARVLPADDVRLGLALLETLARHRRDA